MAAMMPTASPERYAIALLARPRADRCVSEYAGNAAMIPNMTAKSADAWSAYMCEAPRIPLRGANLLGDSFDGTRAVAAEIAVSSWGSL